MSMSTRMDTMQDFNNVINSVNATPIQLSRYNRELVNIRDKWVTIFTGLEFSRRSYFNHLIDETAQVQVALLKYVESGMKEYFIQLTYFEKNYPKTKSFTTQEKRSKINYYLKKNNFAKR